LQQFAACCKCLKKLIFSEVSTAILKNFKKPERRFCIALILNSKGKCILSIKEKL